MSGNRGLLARRAVWTLRYNIGTGNITTGAWQQILASIPFAASAVEIFNQSGSIIKLANDNAGAIPIPYTVFPGGSTQMMAVDPGPATLSVPNQVTGGFRKGVALYAEAQDVSATTGYLIINAFE